MKVRKHHSGNEYISAGDVMVRNFTKTISPLNLTHLYPREDYNLVLKNEEMNKNYPRISDEKIVFEKIVIVSDGFNFAEKHLFLKKLPKDVCVLAVNKALRKWKLYGPLIPKDQRRTINAYIVNNPFRECISFLPESSSKYYPVCIASRRTNSDFLKKYTGNKYTYAPAPEEQFGTNLVETYYIDEYRNPICAAIGLAFRFGVKKLMLVCCDDSFEKKEESAVRLDNGLYTYPQHIRSQEIIDANLYWLTHQEDNEIIAANYSSGLKYTNALYISNEEEALNFFVDSQDGTIDV